jgi:glycogen phosphorylase
MTRDSQGTSGAVPVAYFTMEIGLETGLPTYAGGLGVLAGDTVRAAADLGLNMIAVTLLHRSGYFDQQLGADGVQHELPVHWDPAQRLEAWPGLRLKIRIEGRPVTLCAWRYRVRGIGGSKVPVYFLDADLPENEPTDRALTGQLYGGDRRYRLAQEVVLGMGGVGLLQALGQSPQPCVHLNEGHAALSVLALVEEELDRHGWGPARAAEALAAVRPRCVFTTHTPVAAGHDRFSRELVTQVLGDERQALLTALLGEDYLDMTALALCGARFANAVSIRHAEVSRAMFPERRLLAITNGVHAVTWTAPEFQKLFDAVVPGWRRDAALLHYALEIPAEEIARAHAATKRALLARIERECGVAFDPAALTLGFARRATEYKRAALLLRDPELLAAIAREQGPLQLVFAGKAHPSDLPGKQIIRALHGAARSLGDSVRFVYLRNHDMELAREICAGVDVWLNTPRAPQEASGTSGMKAALNGVPSLSVRDGWWVEGHLEGVTGWAIGEADKAPDGRSDRDALDAASLYAKLADVVMPCFYGSPDRFLEIRRQSIARSGALFNATRMVSQYVQLAYRTAGGSTASGESGEPAAAESRARTDEAASAAHSS